MKLNLVFFLSAVILTAQSVGLSAQETKSAEDMTTLPMQLSIVYPMTTQGYKTIDYRYIISFNLFSGKVGAVTGVEFGGFLNDVRHDIIGVQFGGLGNFARTAIGVQFGGLGNISQNFTGVQFGGLGNLSQNFTGIQFGGIANISENAKGVQFGGLTNLSKHTKGAQISGVVNATEKSEGLQLAGVANVSEEVSGASISGVFNVTGTLRGFQLGVVNVIDTIESGLSVALVNIVRKGFYDEWSLTFADYLNVGLSYKMGTQKFYTIYTAGANFLEDRLWVFGIGFGNRTELSPRIDFQPEIVSYQYFPDDFKNVQNVTANHLKIGFVYKLNNKLGVTIAPSIYHLYNDLSKNQDKYKVSPFSPIYKHENSKRLHSFGAGLSVGLSLR